MMKSKVLYLLTAIILILILATYYRNKKTSYILREDINEPITMMIATDIHYLAPELMGDRESFLDFLSNGDGKLTHYCEEITDAFIHEVIERKPQVLVLSGDLTFNGEKRSHQLLADKLKRVTESGIAVFVIPGNHDIQNYNARRFSQGKQYITDMVSENEFKKIYKEMGYQISDKDSLSYVCKLTDDLWLFMLDSTKSNLNSARNPSIGSGVLKESTLDWIEKNLKDAAEKNVTVITVMHHNLLVHSEQMWKGFTIDNNEFLMELFNKYNVKVNLTGHIHIQDIETAVLGDTEINDIATGALAVYPFNFATLVYTPKEKIEYATSQLDVQGWAIKNGITDNNLLEFADYSSKFMGSNSRINRSLNSFDLNNEEIKAVTDMVNKLNLNYFAGTLSRVKEDLMESEGYKIVNVQKLPILDYIDKALSEADEDENHITVNLH